MRLPRSAVVVLPVLTVLGTAVAVAGLHTADAPPGDADRAAVLTLLDSVTVVPRRVHVLGYDREQFGGWRPRVTGRGQLCTTRDIVLFRTFGDPVPGAATGTVGTAATGSRSPADCPTATGTAPDVYTGTDFAPGDAQIDHVFPLAAAWDHGAYAWDRDRRVAFANDVDRNLLAVSADANQAKSDGTPAEWLPSAGGPASCAYVARYLTVAAGYGLSVSDADAGAARRVCRL